MKIKAIKLKNFRNHNTFVNNIDFSENETIITGHNGSGKTSILEAIFLIHTLKSFKKQNYNQIITFNNRNFVIDIIENINNYNDNIILKYSDKKMLFLNNEEVKNITIYLYNHPVACYTPEYLGLLAHDQQDRRNFTDKYIFYSDISYLEKIKVYNRLISQKKSELENLNPDKIYIETLNEKIIDLSFKISMQRQNILEKINSNLVQIYQNLPFKIENVYIKYSTNINNQNLLKEELFSKKTLYGIHRDKLDMVLNNNIIEKFSSIGQKKTFVLLTLLSFIKYIEEERNIKLLTLIDDFEATLDYNRILFIRNLFNNNERQIIYTGIDNEKLKIKNNINI